MISTLEHRPEEERQQNSTDEHMLYGEPVGQFRQTFAVAPTERCSPPAGRQLA
ncbi:unnamed protein product [Protopolystoma xenopodis]|uniref:Uncharacterized protein n=1 Tax=Protopolystoma xenopodis TaxID=117903 RepID=A0A448WCP0_9PLAT|nr:unnamed protein product [Protopolystoma xenopodis]